MDKKDQRINVTLFSTLEYEMVKSLAELHGTSLSMVVAKGFSEWLKKNFILELEAYRDAEMYIRKIKKSAPKSLAKPNLIFEVDWDQSPWGSN